MAELSPELANVNELFSEAIKEDSFCDANEWALRNGFDLKTVGGLIALSKIHLEDLLDLFMVDIAIVVRLLHAAIYQGATYNMTAVNYIFTSITDHLFFR